MSTEFSTRLAIFIVEAVQGVDSVDSCRNRMLVHRQNGSGRRKNVTATLKWYHNGQAIKPLMEPDELRLIQLDGENYLVWICAPAEKTEASMFQAYPTVCQKDCQHAWCHVAV